MICRPRLYFGDRERVRVRLRERGRGSERGIKLFKLKLHIRNIVGRTLVKKVMVKVHGHKWNFLNFLCSMCYIHGMYGMTTLNNSQYHLICLFFENKDSLKKKCLVNV